MWACRETFFKNLDTHLCELCNASTTTCASPDQFREKCEFGATSDARCVCAAGHYIVVAAAAGKEEGCAQCKHTAASCSGSVVVECSGATLYDVSECTGAAAVAGGK